MTSTPSAQHGPSPPGPADPSGREPLDQLDDPTYPALTMGQAAQLLDAPATFLRSLDAADLLHPHRSEGGHRRYSRQQLRLAARLRLLSQNGLSLAAAYRITVLEDELATATDRIAELEAARRSDGSASSGPAPG